MQLQQALAVSEKDVKDASAGILKDLKRFQKEKEDDLKRYMVRVSDCSHFDVRSHTDVRVIQIAYAKCHIDWAKKNLETWEEARGEVDKIEVR